MLSTVLGVNQLNAMMNLFLLATLYVSSYGKNEYYLGWKSYYVKVSTEEQVRNIYALGSKLDLDFLSSAHMQREGLVLVKPEDQQQFIQNLNNFGVTYRIHVDDIKSALDLDDEIINNRTKSITRKAESMPYDNYQQFPVIDAYMKSIANRYPNITTLVTAGNTAEGRPLRYMKISTTNFEDTRKPVIFIDGGMHAREWISPPTVTWAIRKLTEDITEPELLDHFDWILMPVVNPDGYEFTFEVWRLWRKTRVIRLNKGSLCRGVDINRNFDISWNTVGAVDHPCSYNYPGTHAFSEIESQVIRDILHEYLPRVLLYLSMHSFGNLILHPWGYNTTKSRNFNALSLVGVAITDAFLNLQLPNVTRFSVGATASALYNCSGVSIDYAHSIGVPLAYTYELPGLSTGPEGFHLNPKYIEEVCRKTWDSIVAAASRAKAFFEIH